MKAIITQVRASKTPGVAFANLGLQSAEDAERFPHPKLARVAPETRPGTLVEAYAESTSAGGTYKDDKGVEQVRSPANWFYVVVPSTPAAATPAT